ncbi:MAG TPA: post-COAP-1 domain-containing protein [Actinomycetota bacterium]|nr:post-COAP-1 domain-containing protein [Actinomycetota bacterium]
MLGRLRGSRGRLFLVLFFAAVFSLQSRPGSASQTFQASEPPCSPNEDTTTGGGWLLPASPTKRVFALQAGIREDPTELGRLLFINHSTNQRLVGTVLAYFPVTPNSRQMEGQGEVNGQPAIFELTVTDGGEPGRPDMFRLTYVSQAGTEIESAPLGGGNIQIRPLCAVLLALQPFAVAPPSDAAQSSPVEIAASSTAVIGAGLPPAPRHR